MMLVRVSQLCGTGFSAKEKDETSQPEEFPADLWMAFFPLTEIEGFFVYCPLNRLDALQSLHWSLESSPALHRAKQKKIICLRESKFRTFNVEPGL